MELSERNQDAGNTKQRAVALVASCRRRGSTVQGTDKRTKTQSEVRPRRPSTTRSADAPILGAIAGSIDRRPRRRRDFKIRTTHRVKTLDTPEKETEGQRERDVRRFILYTGHIRRKVSPCARRDTDTIDDAHSPDCLLAILLKQF